MRAVNKISQTAEILFPRAVGAKFVRGSWQPVENPWNLRQTEMSGSLFPMIQKLLVAQTFMSVSFSAGCSIARNDDHTEDERFNPERLR